MAFGHSLYKAPASPFERSRARGGRDRLRPRWQLSNRPIIVASLYNGQDEQPFAAGVDSGVNHPGVISGYHTPTLDGSGYNQRPGQLHECHTRPSRRARSRHLFYCPAYHKSDSPKDHMLAKQNKLPPSAHTHHDGFHYNENQVKIAVNKRKASLRKKHGNPDSLKAE
jgi:hypothetical protein